MADRVGQQLGNYRLVKLLGKGGFAEVYLGQHVRLNSKQAAIKILHLIDVDARKFQEEAETTEKLMHPHIVRLLDFDIEQDTPFLVLDYAPGGSLRTRHPKGSIVPLTSVVEYLKELAPALQYAHDQHILHRDIKPDNMLIGRQGELLLSDFGIAVLAQTGRTSLSSAHGVGGTPYYMAPETYRGRPVKESDQYALAVVVYEWLCGSVPFSEGGFIQVGFQHSHEPVPPLREKNPAISPQVEAVIMKALAKEPKDRFASVQTFVQAFEQAYIQARQAEQEHLQAEEKERAHQEREEQVRQAKEEREKTREERTPQTKAERLRQAEKAEQIRLAEEKLVHTIEEHPPPAQNMMREPMAGRDIPVPLNPTPLASEQASGASPNQHARPLTPQPAGRTTPRMSEPPLSYFIGEAPPSSQYVTPPPSTIGSAKPFTRSASRRIVLVGLVGLVIMALASGIDWLTVHQASPTGGIQASPTGGIRASPTGGIHTSPAGSITEFPLPAAYSGPYGIAAGPDGNLWFTEYGADQIGRISPSGTIAEFSVPAAYSGPYGITAGPDGNLWFTENGSNKIGRISPRGTVTEFPLPTASSSPNGIAAGPDGNLWFTENGSNKIGRISPRGTITEFPLPTAGSSPNGIVAGPDGNLWFTEFGAGKIGRFSPSGTVTEFLLPTADYGPFGITAGPDGNLWFTENGSNKIGRISPRGTVTEFPLPAADSYPQGIVAGPGGNLWFTEYDGNKIGRFSPSGTVTEFLLPTAGSHPQGIVARPGGNLWFTEFDGNKIGRFTPGK